MRHPSVCPQCGTTFLQKASAIARGRRFCSRRCSAIAQTESPEIRFWRKVQKTPTCWLWTGHLNSWGYGMFSDGSRVNGTRRRVLATRWIEAFTNGPLPPGICVCHSCDTPSCVRLTHLFRGTLSENTRDMIAKNRHGEHMRPTTHCRHGHDWTQGHAAFSSGRRRCRTCDNASRRRRRHLAHPSIAPHDPKSTACLP